MKRTFWNLILRYYRNMSLGTNNISHYVFGFCPFRVKFLYLVDRSGHIQGVDSDNVPGSRSGDRD